MRRHEAHEVVSALKQLAAELGRPPTRSEFRARGGGLEKAARTLFDGSFARALAAAGLQEGASVIDRQPSGKPGKFRYTPTKIDSYTVHERPLAELFRLAGNPPVLKMVGQPDTHIPYHDSAALAAFIEFCRWYNPHLFLIYGDFMDMNPVSHWPPDDDEPRRLIPHMKIGRQILSEICSAIPNTVARYYLEGNHEDWLRQALVAKIPELADIGDLLPDDIDLDVPTLLNIRKMGFEYFPVNNLLKLGRAYFTHGLYTGQYHANTHIQRLKVNVFYGHMHDIAGMNDTGVEGLVEAHSCGCLSRLDAKFMKGKPTKFVHSFSVHEIFPDGTYTFYKPRIQNGRMAYNGQVFEGKGKRR